MSGNEIKLNITIIVDGLPKSEDYPKAMKVEEIIKKNIPAGEKKNWSNYQLSDRNRVLGPLMSLEGNNVSENDTLALTKKDGGGGAL
ncbi:hypothetical protein [Desulfosporosinus metallidurans]|uniref:Ubiquitin-like domain-containing protein n=1 Tax=Desulfosporosinus metallidurans TaxID=1888891 RepID=A0A1Q8QH77_9FIRM|nr:hypothetical protein [Desulfosporosinus metallidurans]OLN26675.1 hypothetical protein DSOL_4893 [Desulfosporosinus metallidurans]